MYYSRLSSPLLSSPLLSSPLLSSLGLASYAAVFSVVFSIAPPLSPHKLWARRLLKIACFQLVSCVCDKERACQMNNFASSYHNLRCSQTKKR